MNFLLDTNIIIKIWNENPDLLDFIEKSSCIDYKITNDCMCELANGEINNFLPQMSPKFRMLVRHIVNSGSQRDKNLKENRFFVIVDGKIFIQVCNKVDAEDYGCIFYCQNHSQYILVSEDKRMRKSAQKVLGSSRVMNYKQFLNAIKESPATNNMVTGE